VEHAEVRTSKLVHGPQPGLDGTYQVGPFSRIPENPARPREWSAMAPKAAHNGGVYLVSAGAAAGENGPPIITINGIMQADAVETVAAPLSRLTERNVLLVFNASSLAATFDGVATPKTAAAGALGALTGFKIDWLSTVAGGVLGAAGELLANAPERMRVGQLTNPPAAAQLAEQVIGQLRDGDQPVNLVAYSQGATITAGALHLLQQHPRYLSGDLSRIRVLTLGGSAKPKDFPPEVRVSILNHASDPVPGTFGPGGSGVGGVEKVVRSQFLYNDPFAQHVNYLGQEPERDGGIRFEGNPVVTALVRKWTGGSELGVRELPDGPVERA
jgi:pimeloyl-ACP methyl ester carboxylesterase